MVTQGTDDGAVVGCFYRLSGALGIVNAQYTQNVGST